tara:strand:+ start:46 stop:864 length:819 start_codon:yes stop_codon:yes gene_type:complete
MAKSTLRIKNNNENNESFYLQKVYGTATVGLGVAAIGAHAHINKMSIGPIPIQGGGFMYFLSIVTLIAIISTKKKESLDSLLDPLRFNLFLAFALCQGCQVGTWIELALRVADDNLIDMIPGTVGSEWMNDTIVKEAFIISAGIFLAFTISAFVFPVDQVWIGSILGVGLEACFLVYCGTVFGIFTTACFNVIYICGGVVVFCGFVVYDTHILLERARGEKQADCIADAIDLFLDFINIFIRLVYIMVQNKKESQQETHDKKYSGGSKERKE